jgi:hypothetical protein
MINAVITAVFLDTSPLGLVTQRAGKNHEADACRAWVENLLLQGVNVFVPEIADYEIRREMSRQNNTEGIARLDTFSASGAGSYLPISTPAMRRAADLWGQARSRGIVTADPHALDGDVILCAQALTLALPSGSWVIATSNIAHLSHYAPADIWQNITP